MIDRNMYIGILYDYANRCVLALRSLAIRKSPPTLSRRAGSAARLAARSCPFSWNFYYVRVSNQIRGGYRRTFTQYIRELPIAEPTNELGNKVKLLLSAAKEDGPDSVAAKVIEDDINQVVLKLYTVARSDAKLIREFATAGSSP